DSYLLEHNRRRIALEHWERLPSLSHNHELSVIRHEINKKRRHLPIRRLMAEAGYTVQAIKPVFMMSPISIANFLPPGDLKFDLVIFDEASQVKPVDAFGALLRSKKAVVVGDSKQLPPTNFFDKVTVNDVDDEDDETLGNQTADLESVLNLFVAQGAPERMLRWHYRSRHQSLIALSNHEFYDNKLVIFPSPGENSDVEGLKFEYLPHAVYEKGKTRTNPIEARKVAEAVMDHARKHPGLTLGVAAFSMAQQEAIEFQLEPLRKSDPSCEAFFVAHPHEPFFVKNLENVQGDERDVIFISLGYGKGADNSMTMNFGPLNRDGGERRLNVLITRARKTCRVFANFTSDDLDLSRSSARGVVALKSFLSYAKNGIIETAACTGRETDSPFEDAVILELRAIGYTVDPQVGCAGFRIDMAIKDPERPGRYLLGIECDGVTYHSAQSARDRDRLRQGVLESLGWRIHRIWSTDWFHHPKQELNRVVEAIEQAKVHWAGVDNYEKNQTEENAQPMKAIEEAPIIERTEKDLKQDSAYEADPYTVHIPDIYLGAEALHTLPKGQLARYIKEVVDVESPIHIDEVVGRVVKGASLKKAGKRIRQAVVVGAKSACSKGEVEKRGNFLWNPKMQKPRIRSRMNLKTASRKLDLIAPEEIVEAIHKVLGSSESIRRADAVTATLDLFGIKRKTQAVRDHVNTVIELEIAKGGLAEERERLYRRLITERV
ncbi:MAG: DUF3320 domain-containing protein, partial [Planctomycetota bacterium]